LALFQSLGVSAAQNGKRFASGTLVPSGADVSIASGLATVEHCGVSIANVPGLGHFISIATPGTAAGTVRIRSYKPTGAGDVTPIAITSAVAVSWWAVGT